MMKHEFESLAMRSGATIGDEMYKAIERFYMSENAYHEAHGGIYESKRDFVRRVFGGKVNTPKTIAQKIAQESMRENRYLLRYNETATRERLDEMDSAILNHYMTLLRYNM